MKTPITAVALSTPRYFPEDVLIDMLDYLPQRDLTATALVCRSWVFASRSKLYYRVTFDVESPTISHMEDTLTTCAHIRTLVRHLILRGPPVVPPSTPNVDEYGGTSILPKFYETDLHWVRMLPKHSLLSIEFIQWRKIDDVLVYSAVRTTSCMTFSGFVMVTSSTLNALLSMSSLTSLSLMRILSPPVLDGKFTQLRRLSLSTWIVPDELLEIMGAIDPQCPLERLDIGVAVALKDNALSRLLDILKPHLGRLKHLSAIAKFRRFGGYPFMDDVIQQLSSVETLYCGYGTYTPLIMSRLPSTLHTLGLVYINRGYFPSTQPANNQNRFPWIELCDVITRLRHSRLMNIEMVVNVRPLNSMQDELALLTDACNKAGIGFRDISFFEKVAELLKSTDRQLPSSYM
jgi:hypothetical protein